MFEKTITGLIAVFEEAQKTGATPEEVIKLVSEGLKAQSIKINAVLESEVNRRVDEIKTTLQTEHDEKLKSIEESEAEKLNEEIKKLEERLEVLAENAAKEFAKENQAQLVSEAKLEIVQKVFETFKRILNEEAIVFEEENISVIETLQKENETLKTKINESINEKLEVVKENKTLKKEKVFDEISEGLAVTQVVKFKTLVESIDYKTDENYREQLTAVRNAHFSTEKPTTDDQPEGFVAEEKIEDINNKEKSKPSIHPYYQNFG